MIGVESQNQPTLGRGFLAHRFGSYCGIAPVNLVISSYPLTCLCSLMLAPASPETDPLRLEDHVKTVDQEGRVSRTRRWVQTGSR